VVRVAYATVVANLPPELMRKGALLTRSFCSIWPDAYRAGVATILDLQLRRPVPPIAIPGDCWWDRTMAFCRREPAEQIVGGPCTSASVPHRDFSEVGTYRACQSIFATAVANGTGADGCPQAVGQQRPAQACLQVAGLVNEIQYSPVTEPRHPV